MENQMKVVVVGAGAMGSLFGGLLAEAGTEVRLFDIWAEHVEAANEKGLSIESKGETRSVKVQATTDPRSIGCADLILIFVKSNHTGAAAETAKEMIDPDTLVLTLQNGMGNADIIAKVIDPGMVLSGTTSHGATMLGPGRIRHAGSGPTVIGMWAAGNVDKARNIADLFNNAGIETETVDDVLIVLWNKLLINVGINAITALTGIKNGQILDLESTKYLSRTAVEEAMAVARAQDIEIRDDMVDHVFQVAEATAQNRSSMGQDVDRKRQTEIGAINGVVVREGRRLGIETPVNQTLTALIETLEAHYL
jgi:2-dehydropantoate 2-reductase